jgi:F-type H+-transporting ATPase subunit delta
MAEISTIARPYAEALLKAVKDSKEEGLAQKLIPVLDTIDEIADPKLKELASDPSLSSDQIYELIRGMLDKAVPQEAENLLKLVIQNGRIEALPQITAQYRELLNHENKEADVTIETAFPLSDDQVADLIKALDKKFPGIKLLPKVVVDKDLIGGVRVIVGDKVLDGTVKARLAEMQSALTS